MNKKSPIIIPAIIIGAIIIAGVLITSIIGSSYDEYNNVKSKMAKIEKEREVAEKKFNQEQEIQKNQEMQLQTIKSIYQADISGENNNNLSLFGSLFEDIIQLSQASNLFIRSIEYQMNPDTDRIARDFGDTYNVCTLKFFFIGKYENLRDFLTKLNNDFNYLLSISEVRVSLYKPDQDYLLINIGITLYSKKAK